MNLQLKSTLIVLATFVLGIWIGFFGDRWLRHPRPFNTQQMRRPEGFIQFNMDLIQPSSQQKDTVHAILSKYYQKFSFVDLRHRKDLTALVDSMYADLSPILTREQRERLQHRRPGRPPQEFGGGPRPFPPGGGPSAPMGSDGPGGPDHGLGNPRERSPREGAPPAPEPPQEPSGPSGF